MLPDHKNLMRRVMLAGRSGAGKTTLMQALQGEELSYRKTQSVVFSGALIDTPGEYTETKRLGYALALYAYEADAVGLLLAADEPYSLYPPCVTCMVNREVIGIVTKIDKAGGDPQRAARWLELAGCKKIFFVSAYTGEGVAAVLEYLSEGDESPKVQNKQNQNKRAPEKQLKTTKKLKKL